MNPYVDHIMKHYGPITKPQNHSALYAKLLREAGR